MFALDPIVLNLVFLSLAAVVVMLILHYLHQPTPVAYIVTGVLLGPYALGLVTDQHLLERLGEIGLVLLLFFVGTEVSLSRFASNWRLVLVGTVAQVLLSLVLMSGFGLWLAWPFERAVLLAFVLSLSSTAVVLKYLEQREILDSKIGAEVTGILVMQDLLLVPMLLTVTWLGGEREVVGWPYQLAGVLVLSTLLVLVLRKERTPSPRWLAPFLRERELQLFFALFVCFGLALFTGFFGLSLGLGAFVSGIIVAHLGGVSWVRTQLHSFQTFFVALFFVSIGLLINLEFLREHFVLIMSLVLLVFVGNTFINASIFRAYGETWRYSIFAGSMLAQIGELSFLLAATGLTLGTIGREAYEIAILVISLSLLFSPLWIAVASIPSRLLQTKG